jgi:hypothetical protein
MDATLTLLSEESLPVEAEEDESSWEVFTEDSEFSESCEEIFDEELGDEVCGKRRRQCSAVS